MRRWWGALLAASAAAVACGSLTGADETPQPDDAGVDAVVPPPPPPPASRACPPAQIFCDVPPSDPHFDEIQRLADAAIIEGCDADLFCPEKDALRRDMYRWAVRSLYGDAFDFDSGGRFDDVGPNDPDFKYIEKAGETLTKGCSATSFCPNDAVSRISVAVVSHVIAHGPKLAPDAAGTSPYRDLPANATLANDIEESRLDGLIDGCDSTHYCPDDAGSRVVTAVAVGRARLLRGDGGL
jgi:hypothetical protein